MILISQFTDIVMFDKSSNMQLAGALLKSNYPNISVMRGVEYTVSLFFNYVSIITVVKHMITANKAIYNLFVSGIYHKPHCTFKSKSYEFHSRNIGLFSGNDTRMSCRFIGMHRDVRMIRALLVTVSSFEFNTMSL